MPELTVDFVERFYAILAVVAIAAMVIVILLRILAIQSDPALDAYAAIGRAIQARGIVAAWIVALLATVGSLYFSEVARFTPCTLCWYQRIAMYPLVVILFGAALRRDVRGAVFYGAPLAVIGAGVAIYHLYIEYHPEAETPGCKIGAPCTTRWIDEYGYITIPALALTAFVAILCLLWLGWRRHDAA